MAQLIARSVWDREVEGLSPFTPTKVKRPSKDGRFTLVSGKPQTIRPLGEREKVRTASGSSQGNLPMQTMFAIVKFRGRGT